MMPILLLCLCATPPSDETADAEFSNVHIEEPFADFVVEDGFLMQSLNPVKEIDLADGRQMVIAVASALLDGDSPRDRLDAERVCHTKALAALVVRNNDTWLMQSDELQERAALTVNNARERGEASTKIHRSIRTRVEGTVRALPVIGRWMSHDGTTLYLALGTIRSQPEKMPDISVTQGTDLRNSGPRRPLRR